MRRIGLACLLAVALTGCGSTVQMRTTSTGQSDGLGGQPGGAQVTSTTPGGGALAARPGAPSSSGAGTSGQTAGAGAAAVTGSGSSTSGVAPSAQLGARGPLTIGMLVTTASGLQSTGYSFGNTVNEQAVDEALVRGLNAEGGLLGHKIVPVFAQTDTFSSNWESDFTAACASFTQDHKVQVVLGYAFNYYRSFESCLSKRAVPHLTTSFNIPDRAELRSYPGLVALDTPTVDRRGLAKADGAIATGYLTPKNKLGILTDNCPGSVRSLEQVVLPFLKRAGMPQPKIFTADCVNGYADSGSASAQLSNAELTFSSSGVDRIMMYGVSEGPGLAQFALAAQSQNYHPGYIVSSLANLAVNNGTVPPEQARNIHGFGWLPMEDVPVSAYGPRNRNQQRCVRLLKSQGITLSSSADFIYAWQICEPFFVYEAALAKNGGRLDPTSVLAGIQGLGTSFTSVTNLGGKTLYGPGRADAIDSARPLVYADSCGCWRYTGAVRAIPSR